MELPTVHAVDERLAGLLAEFAPGEITERQRAEDLVACALTLYGGALRRVREIHHEHGADVHSSLWTTRVPLGELLALHQADSPAPPPVDTAGVRRSVERMEAIIESLSRASEAVRQRSMEMLALVADLHEAALAQITGAIDEALVPPPEVWRALGRDDLVASVLLIHGLHPDPIETRVEHVVGELQRRSGPAAHVDLLEIDGGAVHLRVEGANQSDAYRLRLNVERLLAERVPDLASVTIDGGAEPVPPTSVFIPVGSLTRRRPQSEPADAAP